MPRFTTLYSGSSGNCAVVEEDGRYLMVDMGGSCRATVKALEQAGLALEGLLGIFITHEHSDHIRGLEVFLKKVPVPLFATRGTLFVLQNQLALPAHTPLVSVEGQMLDVGGFTVRAFPTSHDAADSCGYRIVTPGGGVMAIATDLGKMTADVFVQMEGAAMVALEANYDKEMLRTGSYPPSLKRRIASVTGHLSNEDSANTVAQLVSAGCRKIALCHLSEENNTPGSVRRAVEAAMFQFGQRMPEGCVVQVARRHEVSDWMEF